MRPTSIDHIAIYVSDLGKAKKFFQDLGLEVDGTYGDEVFFRIGKQKLAIFKGNNTDQTVNHIAISVGDFEETIAHLNKLGYKVYDSDMVDGPDGIHIQIVKR
ncbi:VOC family protein [Candidatus Saccharibacteria bacterium]|nr:VOC family protein [Candidatus Saccharibacteria bacterium]